LFNASNCPPSLAAAKGVLLFGVTNAEAAAVSNSYLAADEKNGSWLTVKIPALCSAGICVEGVNSSTVVAGLVSSARTMIGPTAVGST
jgi:hypothetical protein